MHRGNEDSSEVSSLARSFQPGHVHGRRRRSPQRKSRVRLTGSSRVVLFRARSYVDKSPVSCHAPLDPLDASC